MSNGEGVTYTVKELISMLEEKLVEQLGAIQGRLDRIDGKLDDKASNLRVQALEERVGRLELGAAGAAAVATYKWAFWGLAIAALAAISTLVWLAVGSTHG